MICHRRFPFLRHCVWGFNQEEQDADRQAEIIRVSLENIHRLGLDYPGLQTGGIVRSARRLSAIQAMRPDDRREYINNLLVSRVSILNCWLRVVVVVAPWGGSSNLAPFFISRKF